MAVRANAREIFFHDSGVGSDSDEALNANLAMFQLNGQLPTIMNSEDWRTDEFDS
jgi:hypothetical protein